MFRGKNIYDCRRLDNSNIEKYILSKNLGYDKIELKKSNIMNLIPFSEKDFDKNFNCALISILTCLHYWLNRTRTIQEIYFEIEKNARKYNYNKIKFDTIPFFIRRVYQECATNFQLNFQAQLHYIKGLGFTKDFLKTILDYETPVILSFLNDQRNYYLSHSVTVIGYKDFLIKGKKLPDKIETVFCIYDNWSSSISYIDFDILSSISSICY